MDNDLLKKCASNGILLNQDTKKFFDLISKVEGEELINAIISIGLVKTVLNKEKLKENIKDIRKIIKKNKGNIFSDSLLIKIGFSNSLKLEEENTVNNFENKNIRILNQQKITPKKITVSDFVTYFKSRYESIKKILEKLNFEDLISLRKIGRGEDNHTVIVSILSKKITKSGNILLDVDDLTGSGKALINSYNKDLFKIGKNILEDDIIAISCTSKEGLLFVNKIFYPEWELKKNILLDQEKSIAFVGDLHVGSTMFLEKNFLNFIKWINGELGDEKQKDIAKKIKYIFIGGDNVDGVGVTPNQEKYLDIKNIRDQYKKLEELIKLIRKDIQIIMCSGQHDAVWVGEPQPPVSEKFAKGLNNINNLILVNNPSLIEIENKFKILIYHGASINSFINELSDIRINYGHNSPTTVVKEMLKRRHLASIHGLVDYVPYKEDKLVIDKLPNILFTSDQHRSEIKKEKGIILLSGSCWQTITPFEEKVGNNPEPCKVPIYNLKNGEINMFDFSKKNGEILNIKYNYEDSNE